MKIVAKFSCKDLVGDIREGDYDVPDGSTVEDAINCIYAEANKEMTEGVRNSFIFLVDGVSAKWETELKDGDKLRVLYRLLGG